jgi:hypothetical protein
LLVAIYKKKDAQHVALMFFSISATAVGIAAGIIKPTFVTQNETAQSLALREFLTSPLITSFKDALFINKKITYQSNTLNIQGSLHAADAVTGLTMSAINAYRSPQARTIQCASASVVSALVKYSLKPVAVKTVIGNDHILILSNQNILSAITNTAEQTIHQLPCRRPSGIELVQKLVINMGLEVSYNIIAQLLRKTAQQISLPEETLDTSIKGVVDACIPENYEPSDSLQHMVKLGINGATCIAIYGAYAAYAAANSALMTLSARCQGI